jgi:hypothetical protein
MMGVILDWMIHVCLPSVDSILDDAPSLDLIVSPALA